MLSGAEFVYVGMPVATYAFSLYAGPEIKEVTDLRGKVLGVITKGASFDHTAIALLRQYKMTQQDMKGLYFSRQEDAPAALIHGIVQAGGAFDADYVDGAPLGLQGIGHIGALKLHYPFMGLAVRRSAILQSPDVVRGFLQAMVAGLRLSIEQPNISKRAIGKYLASKDQEIIDEV